MKAIVQDGYGPPERVLRLGQADTPSPTEDTVLVRVHASSVNSGDWRRVYGEPLLVRLIEGLRRPRTVLVGVDVAGVVEAVGSEVTDLKVGDEVYGMRNGAFAEYVVGRNFVAKPANLTLEQAAAVPAAACTALQAVRDHGQVAAGQRVLINGAGGGVGSFAVQIAKAHGAELTAVTRTDCLELAALLGADHTIDYTRQDFTRAGRRYDLIVDCAGSPSVGAFRRALEPNGRLVLVAAGRARRFGVIGRFVGSQLRRRVLRQAVYGFIAHGPFNENLLAIKALIEAGKVRPAIERNYPLSEAAAAIERARSELVRGKLVIKVVD